MPYRVYLLQRIQPVVDEASGDDRDAADALLADVGLSSLLTLRTSRQVERRNNLEVWGARHKLA